MVQDSQHAKNFYQNTGHAVGYANRRDRVESAAYGQVRPSQTLDRGKTAAFARILKHGTLLSPSFTPAMRPRYGVLDFTQNPRGGASHIYGKSFLVVHEHVKHRASFLHTDSFLTSDGRHIVSFMDLGMVMLYCSEAKLKAIGSFVSGVGTPGFRLPEIDYIEAQLHTEIMFNRDIAKLYLAESGFAGLPHGLVTQVRENVASFCRTNGIQQLSC